MAQCIFCAENRKLTREHVFPAALGGVTAPRVSCAKCNSELEKQFEGFFVDQLLPHRHALRVKNSRTKRVPSVVATARVQEFEIRLLLDGNSRSYTVVEEDEYKIKEVIGDDGRKGWEIFALTERGLERGKAEAVRLGAKRFSDTQLSEPLLEPVSEGSWDFTMDRRAFRTAAKVAVLGLAAQNKGPARLRALHEIKRFVRYDEGGEFASLFFNPDFAQRLQAGPHQHLVQYCFDFRQGTIYAIVVFFGALFYLVRLSNNARSADYGFTHAEDTLTRRTAKVIVSRFDNECAAVRDVVHSSKTEFNNVLASATHYTDFMRKHMGPDFLVLTERRFTRK